MSSAGVLGCRDVSVVIGGARLLDGVDLDVHPGEVLAVVGPNGAGKSTLLSVLCGDRTPTSGTVAIGGRAVATMRPRELARERAVLLQHSASLFSFTAHAIVAMGRFPVDDPASDASAVASALARTAVSHLAQRAFTTLSGGEQTLVQLARVLAQQTPIVLLDEPTAALDLAHQELVCGIARDLARQGTAVFVILHELNLAARYADRVAVLHGGRVATIGPPVEALRPELLSAAYGHRVAVVDHPLLPGRPLVLPYPVELPTQHQPTQHQPTQHQPTVR